MNEKIEILLFSFIAISLLMVGCSSKKINIDEIAIQEAKKITSQQGYTLKSETLTDSDISISDSQVFDLIKEASVNSGYNKDKFDYMTYDRKIVGYELEEKSKKDESIIL